MLLTGYLSYSLPLFLDAYPPSSAAARKQALQVQVLAIRKPRLLGIALIMRLVKTLIALRDMAQLLESGKPPAAGSSGKRFLVAAPT